jgi:hypothetical protein
MKRSRRVERQRGQGIVEFAMLVPVFMVLLLGMLEFGFIFEHTMTISYATREGARTGSALAEGNTAVPCADVDKNVVAAVQRVLQGPGSLVTSSGVQNIKIFDADATGAQIGTHVNVWTYAAGGGPSVDGQNLDFKLTSTGWDACTRVSSWNAGVAPQSIGVSILYNYKFVTPLATAVGFFGPPGSNTLPISDKTVMALNPKS